MKPIAVTGVLLLAFSAAQVNAACPTATASRNEIKALLSGNYACATRGADTWNELHQGTGNSGSVQDYKRGPTDPVDPTEVVGTYTINNTNPDTITYNYTTGESYTYVITPKNPTGPGLYQYCNISTSEVISVTVSVAHC